MRLIWFMIKNWEENQKGIEIWKEISLWFGIWQLGKKEKREKLQSNWVCLFLFRTEKLGTSPNGTYFISLKKKRVPTMTLTSKLKLSAVYVDSVNDSQHKNQFFTRKTYKLHSKCSPVKRFLHFDFAIFHSLTAVFCFIAK